MVLTELIPYWDRKSWVSEDGGITFLVKGKCLPYFDKVLWGIDKSTNKMHFICIKGNFIYLYKAPLKTGVIEVSYPERVLWKDKVVYRSNSRLGKLTWKILCLLNKLGMLK